MSDVENILLEAWDLGLNEIVMQKVTKKMEELRIRGERPCDTIQIYDDAFREAKIEANNHGSWN